MQSDAPDIDFLTRAIDAAACNPSYVGNRLADFVRRMIMASTTSGQVGSVAEAFVALTDVLNHLDGFDGVALNESLKIARESLSVKHDGSDASAAISGARYLVALTATDGYAQARMDRARSAFRADMKEAVGRST